MPWVRLDEKFARNPKVVEAGPLGIAMQVAGLCYCNDNLTDGRVPTPVAATLLDFTGLGMRIWSGEMAGGGEDATWQMVVADLVAAGLWHEPGHDCPSCPEVRSGYFIHDYFDYQPSKEQVEELREARSAAGRKGGQARAKAIAKQVPEQTSSKRSSKKASKPEAKSYPDPVPVPDREPLPTVEVRDAEVVTIGRARSDLDDLKDTLVELFGEPPPQGWSLYNRVATWIRDQGGTPDEVRYRAGRLAAEWGPKTATVTSLEKHWNRYAAAVGQVTDLDAEQYAEAQRKEKRRLEAEAMTTQLRGLPG